MNKARDIHREIVQITSKLIELGLCDDQQFPILREVGRDEIEVTFDQSASFSQVLRNIGYVDAYNELKINRDYNMSLADGALVQLQYLFVRDEVSKHRLAFYPSPDLSAYQNDPDLYENDVIYAEILQRGVVTTPLRFDFDRSAFEEEVHPMCHLTIGQYRNCRVPVASALSPHRFFEFILNAFYNTASRDFGSQIVGRDISFSACITSRESQRVHLSLPVSTPTARATVRLS